MLEGEVAQARELLQVVERGVDAPAQLLGPTVDATQFALHVELGVGLGGHQQGRVHQVELGLGAAHHADEVGADAFAGHHVSAPQPCDPAR